MVQEKSDKGFTGMVPRTVLLKSKDQKSCTSCDGLDENREIRKSSEREKWASDYVNGIRCLPNGESTQRSEDKSSKLGHLSKNMDPYEFLESQGDSVSIGPKWAACNFPNSESKQRSTGKGDKVAVTPKWGGDNLQNNETIKKWKDTCRKQVGGQKKVAETGKKDFYWKHKGDFLFTLRGQNAADPPLSYSSRPFTPTIESDLVQSVLSSEGTQKLEDKSMGNLDMDPSKYFESKGDNVAIGPKWAGDKLPNNETIKQWEEDECKKVAETETEKKVSETETGKKDFYWKHKGDFLFTLKGKDAADPP